MSEEQQSTHTSDKNKVPKHRSPNYPFIGLEDAVDRLQLISDTGRGHFVTIGTARGTWGYQRNAGDRTAAALKAYGLVEVKGEGEKREIKPTEAGAKILEGHSQLNDLLKEAALRPEIHREVWAKYEGNLPADVVIREYLRWEKKFNPENIDKFIKQFRDTIVFANLSESDKIKDGENRPADYSGGQGKMQQPLTPQNMRVQQPYEEGMLPPAILPKSDVPEMHGNDVLSFNLSRTGKAQVRFNGQVTQEGIRKLIALLDLSVDTYPTQAELVQPQKAIWKNKDYDQPVSVTGDAGRLDGRAYLKIEGSETGIPADEVEFEVDE